MVEELIETITRLLASNDPDDVAAGLAKVWGRLPTAGEDEKRRYVEVVSALFYIDNLDHPEYVPIIEDAISLIASVRQTAIPILMEELEGGDVKAQMAIGKALGQMGATVIPALLEHYHETCPESGCRAFVLYALGKIKSPRIIEAVPTALEAAGAEDLEVRDSATRALGKFAESIPPGALEPEQVTAIVERMRTNLADPSPAIRAKAVRTLGKLAHFCHLSDQQSQQLTVTLHRILGEDEHFEWDRAYVVRKEARQALQYV